MHNLTITLLKIFNLRISILILLILLLNNPVQATILKGGKANGAFTGVHPVVEYSFDEGSGSTINDSSVSGYNGTLNGTINGSTWVNGQYGKALYFNGTDNYISFAAPSLLAAITNLGPVTYTMWIRRDVTTNAVEKAVISKSDNNEDEGWWIAFRFFDNIGYDNLHIVNNVRRYSTFSTGAWHHLAITFDAEFSTTSTPAYTSIRIYIDGAETGAYQDDQNSVGTKTSDVADSFLIGKSDNAALGFYDGYLDNVRIYRKVLTAAEITADMNTAIVNRN